MELFKLLGTIAVNNSDANKSIDETDSKTQKLATKMKSAGEKVTSFGSKVASVGGKLTKGITVPAVAAGTAVMAFANKSASTADKIDKMSQKIGISRKAYQEFDFICSQSGTSVDILQMGMKTLTSAMDGAASGTKANVEQFKKLGVSVTDASGNLRSQEDVMMETLSALQGMENQTEKARLATELFGRSGSELMPLLNGEAGSIEEMKNKAHELGLVMGDEAIDAGVEYTDKMDQLKRSFGTAAAKIGTKMLPILTKLGDFIIQKGIPAFEKIANKVGEVVEWFENLDSGTQKLILTIAGIVVALGPVLSIGGKIIGGVGSMITAIAGLNPVILAVIAVIGTLVAAGVLLYKNWDKIKAKAIEIKNKVVSAFDSMKSKVVSIFGNIKTKTVEIFTNIKDGIVEKVKSVKNNVTKTFEKVKYAMTHPVETARNAIKKVIDKIKGFFDFDFKLPKIKLPHFSIKPSGWSIGDLLKGKIPKLGIDWYAKAMNNPILMTKPTAFGVNGNGEIMAGGEKGAEVVSGAETLMNMISEAVSAQNAALVEVLYKILDFLQISIPELSDMDIVLDSGALVGTLTPAIDKKLGQTMKLRERGV